MFVCFFLLCTIILDHRSSIAHRSLIDRSFSHFLIFYLFFVYLPALLPRNIKYFFSFNAKKQKPKQTNKQTNQQQRTKLLDDVFFCVLSFHRINVIRSRHLHSLLLHHPISSHLISSAFFSFSVFLRSLSLLTFGFPFTPALCFSSCLFDWFAAARYAFSLCLLCNYFSRISFCLCLLFSAALVCLLD